MKNTTGFKALTALSVQLVILISAVAQVPVHYPYTPSTPASKPLLFGKGVISTRDDEFGGTFTPDGKTIYFSKSPELVVHLYSTMPDTGTSRSNTINMM